MFEELSYSAEEIEGLLEKEFRHRKEKYVTPYTEYSKGDLESIFSAVFKEKSGKLNKIKFPAATIGKKNPRLVSKWNEISEEGQKLVDMASKICRINLGLQDPVKLGDIPLVFKRKGWLDKNRLTVSYLPYIVQSYAVGKNKNDSYGLRVCEVDFLKLTAEDKEEDKKGDIYGFAGYVMNLSALMKIHPALSLATFLCNLPTFQDTIVAMKIKDTVNIQVVNPAFISPNAIKFMYSIAKRKYWAGNKKYTETITWPRIRRTSSRVNQLMAFVGSNESRKWNNLLIEWNDRCETMSRTEWKYKDKNTMRAIYYRAQNSQLYE